MRRSILAVLALGFAFSTLASTSVGASAAPCRNGKGKFVTCPPVKAAKCRDAKGKFMKCDAMPGKS